MTAPTAAKTALQHPSIRNRIVVVGQLLPEFSQFALTESNVNEIWSTLADMVYLNDIILLLIVSFSAIPIARLIHRIWMATPQTGDDTKEGNKGDTSTEDRFAGSYTFTIAQIISHIAKITIIVYVIDCVLVVLYVAGVKFVVSDRDLSVKAAKILYSTYVALRLIQFKRYLIGHAVNRDPDKLEKVILVDKVMDAIVFAYLALHILNTLTIEVTFLSSLFAFGGMGTLIFSLASKDLAVLVVSGLALNVTEKFRKGDQIRLGDSTQGTVEKMGWLYTELRLGDDVIVKLPNSQLSGQRMSNLSRLSKSQVFQTLRIRYEDIDKVEALNAAILAEIKESCPLAITDGTRPFRATWREFKDDHLEIGVDTHYNTKPACNVYWDNRQKVLQAISRAAKKNNITFARPKYHIVDQTYES